MNLADADPAFQGPGPDARFRDALAGGTLMIQRCRNCGEYTFYPRVLCRHCGSKDLSDVPAGGRGTVYSTSVVRQKPEQGGDYNIALIDLEEGPRLMSQVTGVAPAEVRIGMAVKAKIIDIAGQPTLVFERA